MPARIHSGSTMNIGVSGQRLTAMPTSTRIKGAAMRTLGPSQADPAMASSASTPITIDSKIRALLFSLRNRIHDPSVAVTIPFLLATWFVRIADSRADFLVFGTDSRDNRARHEASCLFSIRAGVEYLVLDHQTR